MVLQTEGCGFDLIMPRREEESLMRMLVSDFSNVAAAALDVDLELAEASVASDKEMILELVRVESSFAAVNSGVIAGLRDCWANLNCTLAAGRPELAASVKSLGLLLKAQGKEN